MLYTNRMSAAQVAFLREIRDGRMTLAKFRERVNLQEKRYARWFRNRFFVRNLKRFMLIAMSVVETESSLGSMDVMREMLAAVREKRAIPEDQLKTMIGFRDQNRADRRESSRVKPRRKKKILGGTGEVLHPSCRGREREFLELMKGRSGVSGAK